jgi:serine protease Do
MTPGEDYWDIPLKREDREQLEEDLFRELNRELPAAKELPRPARRRAAVRAGSLLLALLLTALALGRLLNILTLPSLDFLQESRRLERLPGIRALQQAVVSIETEGRRGTGFNIRPDGLIVTNYHVISGARSILVTFPNMRPVQGQEAAGIPRWDLALVSLQGQNLPVLPLAYGARLHQGDPVLIVGNPLGINSVVSEGVVEGFARLAAGEDPVLVIRGPVHRGSSGSPVFNREGLVVAVIFATSRQGHDILGLAVTIDKLMFLMGDIP